jgi:hypothetical protein
MGRTPRKITVLIDSREQYPLFFPETIEWYRTRSGKPQTIFLRTKLIRLPAGDYQLDGYDDAIVERKGCLRELRDNLLSDDYRRAKGAFVKLVEATDHPYLLIDETLGGVMTPTEHVAEPRMVIDALLDLAGAMGIRLLLVGGCKAAGARRMLGEFVVRLLLSHALRHKAEPVDLKAIIEENLNGM